MLRYLHTRPTTGGPSRWRAYAAAICLAVSPFAAPSAAEVKVAAAANFTDPAREIGALFEKATGHRVVNTPWTRYSAVLFFALDGAHEVSPLPRFVSAERPSRYPPITQSAHIEAELERAYSHEP